MKLFAYILFTFFFMTASLVLYDFKIDDDLKNWAVVNDGVMGGLSRGQLSVTPEGHARFSGTISLENNGGFSSLRHEFIPIATQSFKRLKLRIKGDGKSYQIRIKKYRSDYFSYIAYVQTSTSWETLSVELRDFYPYFRGYQLNKPNFDGEQISQFGILIGNKKSEQFELLIDSIEFE